jgi:glycolate oxidase FAD binding subunit
MSAHNSTEALCKQVDHAFQENVSVAGHSGIIEYRASELVLTARSGTRLSEIENTLAENRQMLAFEPPVHSPRSTLGGSIASGLSGPRRPFAGAARDFVLGTTIINGKGERLKFGGQVMKNVAGYDASRLMTGAQGTLGVLLDISAHRTLRQWILQGHPLSASCYFDNQLFVRLSSTVNGTKSAHSMIGGELQYNDLWTSLRHQTNDFFQQQKNLWRVSVPPSAGIIASGQAQLTEWNGALRWIASDSELFSAAKNAGGHATQYRLQGEVADHVFQPLSPTMLGLHQRLKKSFDPKNILNPGRLYPGL